MIANMTSFLRYMNECIQTHTDIAVIGMSGGADSTLVAILLAEALGPENVMALHLPANQTDHFKFNKNSVAVAERLGLKSLVLPIGDVNSTFQSLLRNKLGTELSRLNEGNLRARLRMSALYAVAKDLEELHDSRVRVVGTGNRSEIYIGYDTKGGDTIADFFPIGELYKSEVYQCLQSFSKQGRIDHSHIDYTPSAGLWDGQTDEGELGYNYDIMERAIRQCSQPSSEQDSSDEVIKFVKKRHESNQHKYAPIPVFKLRQFCD